MSKRVVINERTSIVVLGTKNNSQSGGEEALHFSSKFVLLMSRVSDSLEISAVHSVGIENYFGPSKYSQVTTDPLSGDTLKRSPGLVRMFAGRC